VAGVAAAAEAGSNLFSRKCPAFLSVPVAFLKKRGIITMNEKISVPVSGTQRERRYDL
jgi:hypothetical protein